MLTIYVDADACPVKDEVYRVAPSLLLAERHRRDKGSQAPLVHLRPSRKLK